VELRWGNTPACAAPDLKRLSDADAGTDPIVFSAGSEWRLLGTYNPLDAARVFRFGQALGRRLKEIPIPAATAKEFEAVLEMRAPALSIEARSALIALYTAHLADPVTQLGPAVFFDMVTYILNGVGSEFLGGLDESIAPDSPPGEESTPALAAPAQGATTSSDAAPVVPAPAAPAPGSATPASPAPLSAFIAEAYLMNPGKYVSKYPRAAIDKLGGRIVTAGALPEEQWTWVSMALAGLA
jgi:hypothetical protein